MKLFYIILLYKGKKKKIFNISIFHFIMIEKTDLKTAMLYQEDKIKLRFYPLPEMVRKIRVFSKLQYEDEEWIIPLTRTNAARLLFMGFRFNPVLKRWYEGDTNSQLISDKHTKKLSKKLYPFQLEGVNHIEKCNGKALIADEMGLGKTVQALAWLKIKKEYPALIVCPSSLKTNWDREILKWTKVDEDDIQILSGKTTSKIKCKIAIINYDILDSWKKEISEFGFRTCILDEGHYIKNAKAKRTKAFKFINKNLTNLIILTGTPITNHPIDIYNILFSLNPALFSDYYAFVRRYCDAKRGYNNSLDVSGASNTEELNQILTHTVMIRRLKQDVLPQLPSKQINKVFLDINNLEEYQDAEKHFIDYLHDNYENNLNETKLKRDIKQYQELYDTQEKNIPIEELKDFKIKKLSISPILAQIALLKQLAIKGKLSQIIDWIKDFLETNDKLVVFAIHRDIVEKLMEAFSDVAVIVYGGMSQKQRQESIDSFQTGKAKLFIGNMKAAGVGLTLTAASNVLITEYPDVPNDLLQAIDRVHRITQIHQVTVWNMIGNHTIEEEIIQSLYAKQVAINGILDGKQTIDNNIFDDLIKTYLKK